jgi:putative Holliday junction resolvase
VADTRARIVLAFDFGLRRIGVAVGDTVSRSAAPRKPVFCPPGGPDWTAIEREIRSCGPDLLLVGDPYNDDGTPSSVAPAANRFVAELARRSGLQVVRMDERYSSVEAAGELKSRRASGERKRRLQPGDIDSAAAAVILGSWLQNQT